MHIRTSILTAVVVTLSAAASSAQVPRTMTAPHTTVEIVAASPTLEPGGDLWVGVRFLLEPGWHIYWRNPGDSGAPPLLLWTTPAGVSIGDVEWPAPERIPYGALVNYGYHGDVILPMRVRSSSRAQGPLVLDANWMVCKDVCVRARARVALAFPLAARMDAVTADWAVRITEARRRVPIALPKGWTASATVAGATIHLRITAPVRLASASFFPIDEGVIDVAAPAAVTPATRGLRLGLKVSDQLAKTPATLHGVLVLPDGTAYELTAPIASGQVAPGKVR